MTEERALDLRSRFGLAASTSTDCATGGADDGRAARGTSMLLDTLLAFFLTFSGSAELCVRPPPQHACTMKVRLAWCSRAGGLDPTLRFPP